MAGRLKPAGLWQQPYVNVFKHLEVDLDANRGAAFKGDVVKAVDRSIGRVVYKLAGQISSANTMTSALSLTFFLYRLCNFVGVCRVTSGLSHFTYLSTCYCCSVPASPHADLHLTGRFVYLQVQAPAQQLFTIHIECVTNTNFRVRLSFSNMYKEVKVLWNFIFRVSCQVFSSASI